MQPNTESPRYTFRAPVYAKIYLINGKTRNYSGVEWTSNEGRFMLMGLVDGKTILVNSDNVNLIEMDDKPVKE